MLGIILIFFGFIVEFVGRPERGGQSFGIYMLTMRSGSFCLLFGICLAMADNYLRGSKDLPTQGVLPRNISLLLFIGGVMILASVVLRQRNVFYDASMAIGAICELVGGVLTWRWLRAGRSRTIV